MGLSNGRWRGRIPPFTVTLSRVVIHWSGLADQTSMFREAKEVDSQISHAAQYASTLLRPTRATRSGMDRAACLGVGGFSQHRYSTRRADYRSVIRRTGNNNAPRY